MKRFMFLLLAVAGHCYQPTDENLRAREWFQDSKFGLFIHWGPYSVFERGEWVLEKSKLSLEEYEKQGLSQFNPTKFDPAIWVKLAKDAGMKYITVTSRHHHGFAMWATKQNDWNVVERSPYGKDPLKLLAEECHKEGMELFFYYSQLDWHHPNYSPLGKTGHYAGRNLGGDFHQYLDYMDAQLMELLTGYGKIAGVWFDGMWDKPEADWRLQQTYSLIHYLQPAALVGSNHHLTPFEGEDFQMFEKDLPGQCTQKFNHESTSISSLPLEMCETINHSWGYHAQDQSFKSVKDLIHCLVKAAGNNANFLLNIGPCPDGSIQPEFVKRLQEVGTWLQENGESIYGTRGGPITPKPWGVSTRKENRIYLHVLQCENRQLSIPYIPVVEANAWPKRSLIQMTHEGDHLVLDLSSIDLNEVDTIIELRL